MVNDEAVSKTAPATPGLLNTPATLGLLKMFCSPNLKYQHLPSIVIPFLVCQLQLFTWVARGPAGAVLPVFRGGKTHLISSPLGNAIARQLIQRVRHQSPFLNCYLVTTCLVSRYKTLVGWSHGNCNAPGMNRVLTR